MAEEEFRLPGTSYDLLVKIIKAYRHQNEPARPDAIADVVGVDKAQVSRNHKFLVSVGVLEGGNLKRITPIGNDLGRALEYEHPSEIQRLWRQIIADHPFVEKILTAVRIRGGMERSNLESHIAYTAGQVKNRRTLTGAGTVVEILFAADLVRDSDGTLEVSGSRQKELNLLEETDEPQEPSPVNRPDRTRPPTRKRVLTVPAEPDGVSIEIQIEVACSVDDLDSLGPKLKTLLEEIRSAEPAEPDDG